MQEGQLFVVSGPSGAGKGTLCKMLLEKKDGIALSVSVTTRRPRAKEIEGTSYYFISHQEFKSKIEAGEFLEYAQVYGNYYGTPAKTVFDTLKKGIDVILEIDPQGALQIKKSCNQGVFIFILPPSMEELKRRLMVRGAEDDAQMALRMNEAAQEISLIGEYDYCVINEELTEAVDKISAIITAERSRVSQNIYEIVQKF